MELGYQKILQSINLINPIEYAKSRNYKDGHITRLGPYISRGLISTAQIAEAVLVNYSFRESEKFIQELAWRDHWQKSWMELENINRDLRHRQDTLQNGIPESILNSETGIDELDKGINTLQQTGFIHNHMRMYIASLHCNIAKCDWLSGARWMYYYLLDADWASNALSWQWVAGTNSNKKYLFNQDNINHYFHSDQKLTYLDISYDELSNIEVPEILKKAVNPDLVITYPNSTLRFEETHVRSINIYNWYNVDPNWNIDADRKILLIEPSIFEKFPISKKSFDFLINLFNANISKGEIYVGEFDELRTIFPQSIFHFKQHPLNCYEGIEHPRDWISEDTVVQSSFFKYWKNLKIDKDWT